MFACFPALPPPPPGYHYGRPRRLHKSEDEYGKSDVGDEEEDAGDEDRQHDDDNPADEDYHDQRFGIGRGRGRQLGRRKGKERNGY